MDANRAALTSPATDAGFNFSSHMARLCAHITATVPRLRHVDMDRVAIRFCQVRKRVLHGLQATLTPMRFNDGALTTSRMGRQYTVQRLLARDGREILYLLSFYLPRYLDQPFRQKLITIFHELWHIAPSFNGDLRRQPGRCYAHGPSEHDFDMLSEALAQEWLAQNPSQDIFEFLHEDFRGLLRRHGSVYGLRIRTPRLIPVSDPVE